MGKGRRVGWWYCPTVAKEEGETKTKDERPRRAEGMGSPLLLIK